MEGEKRKHKRFDKDFKLSAVKMITDGGHKASEVARSLDSHPNMLYSWKRKYADNGARRPFPAKAISARLRRSGDGLERPRWNGIY